MLYRVGDFLLDSANRELSRDGEVVALPLKTLELLVFMVENRAKILTRKNLVHGVWGQEFVEDTTIAQQVYRIRKALGDNDNSLIKTVPKLGYRFVAPVDELDGSAAETARSMNVLEVLETNEGLPREETSTQTWREFLSGPKRIFIENRLSLLTFILITFSVFVIGIWSLLSRDPAIEPSSFGVRSIAVLPFKEIGASPTVGLGLGVADVLISNLSRQDQISVRPTASIIKYSEQAVDNAASVGKDLEVDAVLHGTIQTRNEKARVNIQLIRVQGNTAIWTDTIDVDWNDIFALQDRISAAVAERLSLQLKLEQVPPQNKHRASWNFEAFQAYSMGLLNWERRTRQSLTKAVEHFQDSIKYDPGNAEPHAFLADCYALLHYNFDPTREYLDLARDSAEKALALDTKSSDAIAALALVSLSEKDEGKARELLERSVSYNPDNATALVRLALLTGRAGEAQKSIELLEQAEKVDPRSLVVNGSLAFYYRITRNTEKAIIHLDRADEIVPSLINHRIDRAEIREQNGDYEEAISLLGPIVEKGQSSHAPFILARIFAKTGRNREAREIAESGKRPLDQRLSPEDSYRLALVYLHLNDRDKAISLLKTATYWPLALIHLKHDYNLDPIRGTPEFAHVLRAAERTD